jgi:hypothetical protein
MTAGERDKYDFFLKKYGDQVIWNGKKKYLRAQHEFVRWKCLTDLYYLGTVLLGLGKVKKKVYPKFHRWLCRCIELAGDKMIMVPRKHGKTTWMKAWIVQRILLSGGNIRILLLSKTEMLATFNLASIKRMLAMPALRRYFPEVVPEPGKAFKKWAKSTTNELRLKDDNTSISNEPQIIALGSAATFTGTAIDLIVMDDYIDDQTVRTVGQMMKVEEEWGYLQPILDDGGEIMIIGTFYHYNDIYNKIIKEGQMPKNRIFIRRAIENGKILYPTIFNRKKLMDLKKRQGNYQFSCQYMLNPVPKEDQVFPGPQPTCQQLPKDKYRYYILMDPALVTTGKNDKTGVAIAAINKRDVVYFVEAYSFRKDGPGKAEWLIQKCLQYNPEKVGVEYGLQQNLDYIIKTKKNDYELRTKCRVRMNIESIKVNNKMSKGDRIYTTLGSFVRQGKVQIIEAGCRELVLQMDAFTGKGSEEDDVVDAASMLFPLVKTFGYARQGYDNMKGGFGTIMDLINRNKKSRNDWRSNFVA